MDYRGIEIRVTHADVFTLPGIGGDLLIEEPSQLPYRQLLFLGVEPLYKFNYRSIRDFSRRALAKAMRITPPVREITMTLHGVGFGLDETEAFESEVAGIVEAIDSRRYPQSLRTVSIIERGANRAARMQRALESLLGPVASSPVAASPPAPMPRGQSAIAGDAGRGGASASAS